MGAGGEELGKVTQRLAETAVEADHEYAAVLGKCLLELLKLLWGDCQRLLHEDGLACFKRQPNVAGVAIVPRGAHDELDLGMGNQCCPIGAHEMASQPFGSCVCRARRRRCNTDKTHPAC